jgi:SAM-dependent methyltransferase
MLDRLKQKIKSSGDQYSLGYNALAWCYGALARKPAVRREARMRAFKDGRFDEDELSMAMGCPRRVLDAIVEKWRPRTALDVGCGLGLAMEHLQSEGVECVGIDGSQAAIRRSPVKDRIVLANLNHPFDLSRTFDLVWSYEVAEHIHPEFTKAYLTTLTRHAADLIVISAAHPGQGGAGHFNEQPQGYWIERLAAHGFKVDKEFSAHLQALPGGNNTMTFLRVNSGMSR